MRTCNLSARIASLALALAAAFPSFSTFAQPALPGHLKNTFVTATRSAQPIGDVVADVTIIDPEVIERTGAAALADVLARVLGIEIARNDGADNSIGVLARGNESRHTIVLIEDGVRVDSQSTSGGVNWQDIPLGQIDRINVVRGPTSSFYGSDAVAGVIQIFTKKDQGAFASVMSLGYQNINTYATARRALYLGLIWAPQ